MPTFFSSTDTSTLLEEGTEVNHFVSLIVNNEGKYTAGVTRKIIEEIKANSHIVYTKSNYYDTFNNERVSINEDSKEEEDKEETIKDEYVEWFNLEIEKAEVVNKFEEIDERLKEIKDSKVKNFTYKNIPNKEINKEIKTNINSISSSDNKYPLRFNHEYVSPYGYNPTKLNEEDNRDLFNHNEENIITTNVPTPSRNLMEEENYNNTNDYDDTNPDEIPLYELEDFDDSLIKSLTIQLITGSIIINIERVDINKWITNLDKIYTLRFGDLKDKNNLDRLDSWLDAFVDFIVYTEDKELLNRLNNDYSSGSNVYDVTDTAEICAYGIINYIEELRKDNDGIVINLIISKLESYLLH